MPTEQQILNKWVELNRRQHTTPTLNLIELVKWLGVTIEQPRTVWDEAQDALNKRGWASNCYPPALLRDLKEAGFTLTAPQKYQGDEGDG